MKRLTPAVFNAWLETCSRNNRENDAQTSANLFSQGAMCSETPFDDPFQRRGPI